jgi:hypothetical protein
VVSALSPEELKDVLYVLDEVTVARPAADGVGTVAVKTV